MTQTVRGFPSARAPPIGLATHVDTWVLGGGLSGGVGGRRRDRGVYSRRSGCRGLRDGVGGSQRDDDCEDHNHQEEGLEDVGAQICSAEIGRHRGLVSRIVIPRDVEIEVPLESRFAWVAEIREMSVLARMLWFL